MSTGDTILIHYLRVYQAKINQQKGKKFAERPVTASEHWKNIILKKQEEKINIIVIMY